MSKGELKCHRCDICQGFGCIGQLPGLGGVFDSQNFQLNCSAWEELYQKAVDNHASEIINNIEVSPKNVRCGPVTGAQENIGYEFEEDFYYPYLENALNAGFGLCVGDGCPDKKLLCGIEAVKNLNTKAAFFLKPYPDRQLLERISWVKPYAEYIGIDIDSYNILTMRNLVNLERKTPEQLQQLRKYFDVPFVIKGVFTQQDVELVKQLKPEVVYISNHGGRVETRIGSTGDFLEKNGKELKNYCDQLWVDGGIRSWQDVRTAIYYGADKTIIARPFIRSTFDGEQLNLL